MSQALPHHHESVAPVDIVVVDDDQLTLEIVSWIFRNTKASFQLFIDSDAAMAHLQKTLPRILVVDYYMPKQNGIDFLAQLKRSVDTAPCTLYLCSAILPEQAHLHKIQALDATILEKSVICDRTALLELVGRGQDLTGNKQMSGESTGSCVADTEQHENILSVAPETPRQTSDMRDKT